VFRFHQNAHPSQYLPPTLKKHNYNDNDNNNNNKSYLPAKTYCHMEFQDATKREASIVPTSEVRTVIMLVLQNTKEASFAKMLTINGKA
jgi:hypothetical protein